ncbi:RING finger protein 225-like [Mustelus asterias]
MENNCTATSSETAADIPTMAESPEIATADPPVTPSTHSDLECIICFSSFDNVFKLPKLLSCGHTFCLECLARINVSSENVNSVACPMCRHASPLPSGKGLPALDNNQDILQRLPSGMQSVPSIRFSRDKGKLYTKSPEPGSFLKPVHLSSVSMSLDVGQPAPRSADSAPRHPEWLPVRSSWCYYVAIGFVLLFTVALVLSGIFLFVIMPTRPTGGNFGGRNATDMHSEGNP